LINTIWSYTVYGNNFNKYYLPILINLNLASSLGIQVIISTTTEYEKIVKNYFDKYSDIILFYVFSSDKYKKKEKVLRYLALKNIEYKFAFIKDSDSIITYRELFIMNNWINLKSYNCLIIRDHELHISPILAGMFGFNKKTGDIIINNCELYFNDKKISKKESYDYDQIWLTRCIYPMIVKYSKFYVRNFYFKNENISIIPLCNINQSSFIGEQYNQISNRNINSYSYLYNNRLLSLIFYTNLPFFISKYIYNRVRPTIYLAFLSKLFSNFKNNLFK